MVNTFSTPQVIEPKDGRDGRDGAKGDKGEPGLNGKDGEDGLPGNDGASFIQGFDDPTANIGNNGDSYLNSTTYDMFYKHNDTWSKVGNIKGQDASEKEYTVTFDTDGGSPIEPLKVKAGEKLPELTMPTRGTDMFYCWTLPTGEVLSTYNDPYLLNIYSVSSDITLKAHYDTRGRRLYNNLFDGLTRVSADIGTKKTPKETPCYIYNVTPIEDAEKVTLIINYNVNYLSTPENQRCYKVEITGYSDVEDVFEALLNEEIHIDDFYAYEWSVRLYPDYSTYDSMKMHYSLEGYLESEGFSYYNDAFNSTAYTGLYPEVAVLAYDFDNDKYCSFAGLEYNTDSEYEIIDTNATKYIAEPGSLAYDLYDVII